MKSKQDLEDEIMALKQRFDHMNWGLSQADKNIHWETFKKEIALKLDFLGQQYHWDKYP